MGGNSQSVSIRAGTIYRFIDNIDIWKADTSIDKIYEISIREKTIPPYLFLLPIITIIQFLPMKNHAILQVTPRL